MIWYFKQFEKIELYISVACFISTFIVLIDGVGYMLAIDNYAFNEFHAFKGSYKSRIILYSTGFYFILGAVFYLFYQKGFTVNRLMIFTAAIIASEGRIYIEASDSIIESQLPVSPIIPCLVWSGAVFAIAASAVHKKRSRPGSHQQMNVVARKFVLVTYPLYLIHFVFGAWVFGMLLKSGIGRFYALTVAMSFCIAGSYVLRFILSLGYANILRPRSTGSRLWPQGFLLFPDLRDVLSSLQWLRETASANLSETSAKLRACLRRGFPRLRLRDSSSVGLIRRPTRWHARSEAGGAMRPT